MTSISSTSRLLRTATANVNRLADEMQRIGPLDIERAIAIQRQLQVDIATIKTSVQLHRSAERKILNEQR